MNLFMESYFNTDAEAYFSGKRPQSWASLILMLTRYGPAMRVPAAKVPEHDYLERHHSVIKP